MKYVEETSIYALLGPDGTARIHASDIDLLPRVDHLSANEYYKRHYMDVIRCYNKGCLMEAVKSIIIDFCFEMDMYIFSNKVHMDDFSMLLDKVRSLNEKWNMLSKMFSRSSDVFNLNEYLFMLNEALFKIINLRIRDIFYKKHVEENKND